jgi:hypothetical protein
MLCGIKLSMEKIPDCQTSNDFTDPDEAIALNHHVPFIGITQAVECLSQKPWNI